MKKLFILAAAIIALASCSKEPETVINDGSIYFTNALATRTTVTTTSSLDAGFTVLGYADNVDLFLNETAGKSGSYWKTPSTKYWANGTTYNFFALYSSNSEKNYAFTQIAGDNKTSATLASFENTGEDDLVLAGCQVVTGNNENRTDAAQLVFKHALSRVKFNFNNVYSNLEDNTVVKIDITDLALVNQAGSAEVTITSTKNDAIKDEQGTDANGNKTTGANGIPDFGSSESKITWGGLNPTGDISYMVTSEFTGKAIEEGKSMATDYKYIVPATGTYKLACKIRAYDETGNTIREFDFTGNNAIDIEETTKGKTLTHEAGHSYVYTMNITSTLNHITFTVAVEEWKEDEAGTIKFPGDNN